MPVHFPQHGRKQDFTSALIWRITYNDGTVLWEKDPNGKENKLGDANFDAIKYFDLIRPPKKAEDFIDYETEYPIKSKRGETILVRFRMLTNAIAPTFRLQLMDGQRLIFARRTKITTGQRVAIFGKGKTEAQVAFPAKPTGKIILVGWQKTENGQNTQAINYIYPDGRIELAGQFGSDADHLPVNRIIGKSKLNS